MDVDLEKEKLELEKKRLEFEIEKHREDVKSERIKTIAVLIPVILVVLTFMFDNYNKNIDYQNQLKIKAAEFVLGAETPNKADIRAKAIKELFPDLNITSPNFYPGSLSPPAKEELAKLIIDHPSQRDGIIDLWVSMYPGDAEWAKEWRTSNNTTGTKEINNKVEKSSGPMIFTPSGIQNK